MILFQDSRTGLVDGIIAFEFVTVKFAGYMFKCRLGSMDAGLYGFLFTGKKAVVKQNDHP
jgi:hypothetical protein